LVGILLPWPANGHESETFEHALSSPSRMTERRQSEAIFTKVSAALHSRDGKVNKGGCQWSPLMSELPVDPGMLRFYDELLKHSPPESVNWPLPEQRKGWEEVCRMFRAPRPERLMVEDLNIEDVHVRV